jgi:hypothetical protein
MTKGGALQVISAGNDGGLGPVLYDLINGVTYESAMGQFSTYYTNSSNDVYYCAAPCPAACTPEYVGGDRTRE